MDAVDRLLDLFMQFVTWCHYFEGKKCCNWSGMSKIGGGGGGIATVTRGLCDAYYLK